MFCSMRLSKRLRLRSRIQYGAKTMAKKDVTVTFVFEGENAEEAAEAFMIQFSDGGMDEDIESRLEVQGYVLEDTDFDLTSNVITLTVAEGDA